MAVEQNMGYWSIIVVKYEANNTNSTVRNTRQISNMNVGLLKSFLHWNVSAVPDFLMNAL